MTEKTVAKELKFRAWNGEMMSEPFYPWDLIALAGGLQTRLGISAYFDANGFRGENWMLYTPFDDKNGVAVCEGDIVRCWKLDDTLVVNTCDIKEGFATAIIEFNGWEFRFNRLSGSKGFFYGPEERAFFPEGSLNPEYEWIEVIGNIKENPELIIPKGQKV